MPKASRIVCLALASVLVALVAAPARAAFSDGATDGEDSRSRLDLASVLRTDTGEKMKFEITTHERFKSRQLDIESDRFFMIGFDLDRRASDARPFERCIFVFYAGRLRWAATDCGRSFITSGLASKPSGKKIVFTANMGRVGVYLRDHEWAAFSFWRGSPCARLCIDSIPNREPLFLRDFTPPEIVFAPPKLLTTTQTSWSFPVEFTVKDPKGSGVANWTLHAMNYGYTGWTEAATGTGGGPQSVPFDAVEGATYKFYVSASDQQGNAKDGGVRTVVVPYDDDNAPGLTTSSVTTLADDTAYGGGLTVLADGSASYSFYEGSPGSCPPIWLIGPGDGDWTIRISWNVTQEATVSAASIPDGPRKVLWTTNSCGFQYTVQLISGTSVAIDAVADEVV